jgi:chlorite dismutase
VISTRYHHYIVFDLAPEFYGSSDSERRTMSKEFAAWAKSTRDPLISAYVTAGFKAGTSFILWCRSDQPEAIQPLLQSLRRTRFGQMATITHTLFGVARKSQYSRGRDLVEQPIDEQERLPYLIIYPFTKTSEWHQLDFNTRAGIMKEHIMEGIQHKSIRQSLLYSYGLDDNEFVVSYECSKLEDFQDLVMALRRTKGRIYTQNDLPIYTCVYTPMAELVAAL